MKCPFEWDQVSTIRLEPFSNEQQQAILEKTFDKSSWKNEKMDDLRQCMNQLELDSLVHFKNTLNVTEIAALHRFTQFNELYYSDKNDNQFFSSEEEFFSRLENSSFMDSFLRSPLLEWCINEPNTASVNEFLSYNLVSNIPDQTLHAYEELNQWRSLLEMKLGSLNVDNIE